MGSIIYKFSNALVHLNDLILVENFGLELILLKIEIQWGWGITGQRITEQSGLIGWKWRHRALMTPNSGGLSRFWAIKIGRKWSVEPVLPGYLSKIYIKPFGFKLKLLTLRYDLSANEAIRFRDIFGHPLFQNIFKIRKITYICDFFGIF